MHKKISQMFLLTSIIVGILLAGGCGNDPKPGDRVDGTVVAAATDNIQEYDGYWEMVDGTDEFWMTAQIRDNEIRVDWNGEDINGVYWQGSWPSTINPDGGDEILSAANQAVLDNSILGSQDANKTFVYENETLKFNLTVRGITTTIKMQKVDAK